jgi:hypothetical protein
MHKVLQLLSYRALCSAVHVLLLLRTLLLLLLLVLLLVLLLLLLRCAPYGDGDTAQPTWASPMSTVSRWNSST